MLLTTTALSACGGGGSQSDSDKIADTIRSTAGISDAGLCDSLFTDQGIQQTYSEDSPEAARKDCQDEVKSKHQVKPSDVDISNVKVAGTTATAVGAVKGNKGYFSLKKDGEDWKIDGVSETPGGASSATTTTPAATSTTPAATTTTPAATTDPEVGKLQGSVLAWARAGRGGNKLAFCGLESPGLLTRQTGKRGNAAVAACVKAFHAISTFPKPESMQFESPKITGNRASIVVKAPGKGNTTTLDLVKVKGLWKIDNAH